MMPSPATRPAPNATHRAAAARNYRDADLGHRVAEATPHELVAMLYDGAHDALSAAARAATRGNAAARVAMVTRSLSILDALDATLDHVRGGTVARALAASYAQVRALTVAANSEQRPEVFAAAAEQIAAIGRSWSAIGPARRIAA